MRRGRNRSRSRLRGRRRLAVQPTTVVEPLPVVEPVVVPEPVTLTPEQFAELPFKTAREYALGLYGIKARSKAELLREYIEARG